MDRARSDFPREIADQLADALDECAGYLMDRTPDIVEPQLDAMSDEEARDHGLFHQTIKPALHAYRKAVS